jgi:hypothetical protein
MTLAPFAAPVNRALMQATKGLPVGASIKNVGQELIYHGTSPKAAKAIEKSGFDVAKSADGTIWFTNNPNIGEVAATGKGAVVKRFLDEKKMKLGGWDDTDKFSTDELIQKGFDGLKLEDKKTGEITYQIFNPEKLAVNKSYSYPQQEALDTAQRNAALPVEKGGLGLPKDNTPEMREKAMGFIDAYHGTTQGARKEQLRDAEGWSDVWATDNPKVANTYATGRPQFGRPEGQAVMPLSVRLENPMVIDAPYGSSWRQIDTALPNDPEVLPYSTDMLAEIAKKEGYDSLLVKNVFDVGGGRIPRSEKGQDALTGTTYAIFNPAQVRSRFAAFDPMRKNDKDLLAGVLPLGLLADEEQRKKLYELMPSLLGE